MKKMVSKCCWRDNPDAKKSPEGDQVDQNGSTNNLLDFEETCDKKLDAAVTETKRRSSTASSTTGSGISAFQKYCRHCKTSYSSVVKSHAPILKHKGCPNKF